MSAAHGIFEAPPVLVLPHPCLALLRVPVQQTSEDEVSRPADIVQGSGMNNDGASEALLLDKRH